MNQLICILLLTTVAPLGVGLASSHDDPLSSSKIKSALKSPPTSRHETSAQETNTIDDIEASGLRHQSSAVSHLNQRETRVSEEIKHPAIASRSVLEEGPPPPRGDKPTGKGEENHEKSHGSNRASKRTKRSFLIPGTNWCGVGNSSRDNEELGSEAGVDGCCRRHDYCPHSIERFTTKYNLYNYRYYTISHCDCDDVFRSCLRAAFSEEANLIGELYFNYIGMRCFVFRSGTVCAERAWWGLCRRETVEWTAELRDATKYEKLQNGV